MSIVRKLTEKPWLTPGLDVADEHRSETPPEAAAVVGLRLYFMVVTVMFLLIAAAYLMHRGVGHGMAMEHDGGSHPLPSLPLLWFNTGMLVLGSVAWERTRTAAEAGVIEQARTALIAGGILTVVFVAGQLVAWWQLRSIAETSAVAIFFYLITALHGLHLIGGLVAWGRTLARLSPEPDLAGIAVSVRLCAAYWHFLLLVWLAMFALLLSV